MIPMTRPLMKIVKEAASTWTFDMDKTDWPRGPWDDEPDYVRWVDEQTGYSCQIKRVEDMGHLCGYVFIPQTHPLHGVEYNDVQQDIDVHGGITFSGRDETSLNWIFGFDCAHCGDSPPTSATSFQWGVPMYASSHMSSHGTYRDLSYVIMHTMQLAKQLYDIAHPPADDCACAL